ncbi:hypothetical protein AVEN_264459-1, partial [Araneus ventricosus]
EGPWLPSGRVSASGLEGSRHETRFHRRSALSGSPCVVSQMPSRCCGAEGLDRWCGRLGQMVRKAWTDGAEGLDRRCGRFGEAAPAQVLSLSSDRG